MDVFEMFRVPLPGGHVRWCIVHSARVTMEHLLGCVDAAVNHRFLHCSRWLLFFCPLDAFYSSLLLLCVTAGCFPGGLAAVIYTDAVQTAIMLAGALTLMGFSESVCTWHHSVTGTLMFQLLWPCCAPLPLSPPLPSSPVEASRRSEAGMLWWTGTQEPSLRFVCQTLPVAFLEMTPSTYSETRWPLTCLGPEWSSACPSLPCGTGVLTRYRNTNLPILLFK